MVNEREKAEIVGDAYLTYREAGGKVAFKEFDAIYSLSFKESDQYIAAIETLQSILEPTVKAAAESLLLAYRAVSIGVNGAADAKELIELHDKLLAAYEHFKSPPTGEVPPC